MELKFYTTSYQHTSGIVINGSAFACGQAWFYAVPAIFFAMGIMFLTGMATFV